MERRLDITEVRKSLASIVDSIDYQGDSYIIIRHGQPAAAVVPMHVYRRWKEQRLELIRTIREIQVANPDAKAEQVVQDVLEAQQAVRRSPAAPVVAARRPRV